MPISRANPSAAHDQIAAEDSATSAAVPAPAIVIPEARVRAAPDNAPAVPDNAPVVLAPAVQDNVPAVPGQVAIAVRVHQGEEEGHAGMTADFGVMIAAMIGATIFRPSILRRFVVDFLPEPAAVVAIAKQIRSSHRAFPLFGTGRLFLERPERHRVRITSVKEGVPLFQVGDGPIAFDRAAVERDAFRQLRSKYYEEHVEQGEAPKGTFTKIAKLRGSGLLLGPTNYHSYQPTLRRIYEERYSRRMDFAEFQQREIEIVSDEQTVNDWKEQARNLVTWTTTQEPEQKTFKTLADVEAHFRQHYLPQEVRSGMTLEANGAVARASGDRSMNASIRLAVERERGFPVGVVNAMRPILTDAGLHFFKHRKRVVYVSTVRPLHHPVGQPAKENVLAVLNAIDAMPRCSRHDLGVKVLGEHFEAPEKEAEKTALASDLHYLLLAGHVIEFADGRLDLPLAPKAQGQAQGTADQGQEHEHEAQEGHEHDKEREPRPGHEDEPPAPPEKGHDTPAENVAAVSPIGATEELLPEDEHATVVADEPLIEPEPVPEAAHQDLPANPPEETHAAPSQSLETVSVQPEEEPATVVAMEPAVTPETVPVAEAPPEGLPTKSTVEL